MMQQQPMPYMVATRTESGATFFVRLIFFILFLLCAINVLGISFGKMDLISWFTGFTVKDRDSLNLFIFYLATGAFLLAVAAKWYKLLWWLVVITGVITFAANFGTKYFINGNGPSITETMSQKMSFQNIPRLSGGIIPAAGGQTATYSAQHLAPVTNSSIQPVNQSVQGASSARQQAIDTYTERLKKEGYTFQVHLTPAEKEWCRNKQQREAYRAKYLAATTAVRAKENLKPEWLVEGRCVTGLLWTK